MDFVHELLLVRYWCPYWQQEVPDGVGSGEWSGGCKSSFIIRTNTLQRQVSSSTYSIENTELPFPSFSFPFPFLTLKRMAEAKKKQAHTNKDKDADKNTEAVHDGTAIVRYTHHACIHTSKHKHIQTYKHTYIHTNTCICTWTCTYA